MTDAQLALNASANTVGISKQIATGGYYPSTEKGDDKITWFMDELAMRGFVIVPTDGVPYTSTAVCDNVTVTLNCRFGAKGLNAITNIEIK